MKNLLIITLLTFLTSSLQASEIELNYNPIKCSVYSNSNVYYLPLEKTVHSSKDDYPDAHFYRGKTLMKFDNQEYLVKVFRAVAFNIQDNKTDSYFWLTFTTDNRIKFRSKIKGSEFNLELPDSSLYVSCEEK